MTRLVNLWYVLICCVAKIPNVLHRVTDHENPTWNAIPNSECRIIVTADAHGVYYSLGCATLAPIPDHDTMPFDPLPKSAPDPTVYLDRHWASDHTPWQAFLPRDADCACQCQLFESLSLHESQSYWYPTMPRNGDSMNIALNSSRNSNGSCAVCEKPSSEK